MVWMDSNCNSATIDWLLSVEKVVSVNWCVYGLWEALQLLVFSYAGLSWWFKVLPWLLDVLNIYWKHYLDEYVLSNSSLLLCHIYSCTESNCNNSYHFCPLLFSFEIFHSNYFWVYSLLTDIGFWIIINLVKLCFFIFNHCESTKYR
jgi:hypothetical protein